MATKAKLIADGVITPDQITLTTASTGTNTTAPATTAFVQQEISALVDSSPEALNTLNELAAALGDDANFSTTVTNSIATKLPLAGGALTGNLSISAASPNILLSGTSFPALKFSGSDNTTDAEIYYGVSANDLQFKNYNNGIISFTTNGNEYFKILSDGRINLPSNSSLGTSGTPVLANVAGYGLQIATSQFGIAPDGGANGLKFQIDTNGNVDMSHTGYLRIPRGTTAQRPGSGAAGMIRYNTTLGAIEEFDGSNWKTLSQSFSASGGTVTTSGIYTYHTFTSSGTFTVTSGAKSISYLIVAGGGAGGYNAGAGGGAGGYRAGTTTVDSGTGGYTITIGAGGAGSTSEDGAADNGSNSSAFGVTSTGGGGGTTSNGNGNNGGSGGGGAAVGTGGSGTAGQGNDGGDGNNNDGAARSGAGGGGASAAGQDTPSNTQGGNGGAGSQWLNGSYYAGGGGGSPHGGSGGSGGTGGGGAGGTGGSSNGTAGTANTGGGGGAGGGYNYNGANGGSGIVIIRYS